MIICRWRMGFMRYYNEVLRERFDYLMRHPMADTTNFDCVTVNCWIRQFCDKEMRMTCKDRQTMGCLVDIKTPNGDKKRDVNESA